MFLYHTCLQYCTYINVATTQHFPTTALSHVYIDVFRISREHTQCFLRNILTLLGFKNAAHRHAAYVTQLFPAYTLDDVKQRKKCVPLNKYQSIIDMHACYYTWQYIISEYLKSYTDKSYRFY